MKIAKKYYYTSAIVLIVLIGGYLLYQSKEPVDPFDMVEVGTSTETMNEDQTKQYNEKMDLGMNLLREGDNGNKQAYIDAISAYKEAAIISHHNGWLPYMNLANVYRRLGEFEKADKAYANALKITKGTEVDIYVQRAQMYRYELHKEQAEIDAVYQEALEKASDLPNVHIAYASFLNDTGKYADALKHYEILLESNPQNEIYKQEIENLKAKINK